MTQENPDDHPGTDSAPQGEQPQQAEAPKSTAERKRKVGFFSRIFDVHDVAEAVQEATDQAEIDRALLEGDREETDGGEPEEEKRGWFGRRKKKETLAEGEEAPAAPKQSWIKRLRERLSKTRRSLFDNIKAIIGLSGKLDEDTVEEIEAALLQSDVSMETTLKIVERMKAEARQRDKDLGPDGLLDVFRSAVQDILENAAPGFDPIKPGSGDPYVVMVVGVNGAGKTTTIGKMAKRCTDAGLKTMLVAGDTFRAAAVEQLEIWAQRTGAEFVRGAHGSDPAALCYDAMQKAKAHGIDVVFVDTAGRLQNKSALMEELAKMSRVIGKHIHRAPHETLLVLDATTGQNAHQQVKVFAERVKVTGLIMTKLDGTAKGGVLLSILDSYHIPITLIGVGERVEDLRDFDAEEFSRALLGEDPGEG